MLETREDLIHWLKEMLPDPFFFRDTPGAAYDGDIRQFEYCSRPLWAVFSLLAGGGREQALIEPYIRRIKAGLKPGTALSFPEPTTERRQIAVEMAVYGYGLLCCGERFMGCLEPEERERLGEWLNMVNSIEFPKGNWYFFLLIINYGLKECGFYYSREKVDFACREIESFYLGGGWYKDGNDSQRDYYIPFAFHFYSMLLERYCHGHGLKDVKKRSMEFGKDFIYWMDRQGRTLPFGRSLTYRFAHVCCWCACEISGIHAAPRGEAKDMIFASLNFWASQDIIREGRLTVGYGYPNLILSEDYNAPGSPMWAFKAFTILSLPPDHEFWKVDRRLPVCSNGIHSQPGPGIIIVSGRAHHYALSANQYSCAGIIHHMSKYGKLCYSTAFGWNCSRDVQGISQFAVDSTLALSVKGTGQFAGRGKIEDGYVTGEYVYSRWRYGEIAEVESWLVPVDELFHARVHRIRTRLELEVYEGAFPISGWNPKFHRPAVEDNGVVIAHGKMESGIWRLEGEPQGEDGRCLMGQYQPEVVLQDPNTNIYSCERNAVPCLKGYVDAGEKILACLVYGNPESANAESAVPESTTPKDAAQLSPRPPVPKPNIILSGHSIRINQTETVLDRL